MSGRVGVKILRAKPSAVTSVNLGLVLKERLDSYCNANNAGKSATIRRALAKYLGAKGA